MPPAPCLLLEDYVNHDLSAADGARFEAHLGECPSCRQALEKERGLDRLLSSALGESLPDKFDEDFQRRLRMPKRRRLLAGVAALAASVAFLLLAGRVVFSPEPPAPAPRVEVPPGPNATPSPGPRAQVRFPKNAEAIAVPVPSGSPNVTVVQVYPALHKVVRAKKNQTGIAERRIP